MPGRVGGGMVEELAATPDTWHPSHDQEAVDTQTQPKRKDLWRNTRRVDSMHPLGLTVRLIELEEIGDTVL